MSCTVRPAQQTLALLASIARRCSACSGSTLSATAVLLLVAPLRAHPAVGLALAPVLLLLPPPPQDLLPWEPLLTDEDVQRAQGYYGTGTRMRRVAAKLLAGQPVKVRAGGGGGWGPGRAGGCGPLGAPWKLCMPNVAWRGGNWAGACRRGYRMCGCSRPRHPLLHQLAASHFLRRRSSCWGGA